MTTAIKTRSEQRLEQLDEIKRERPLTDDEIADLNRCEKAIYMRAWKAERDLKAKALAEYHKEETITLAKVTAELPDWPIPPVRDWQDNATYASTELCLAILKAGLHP